jgi:MFS transporter, PHS family, inorganic phosphate transporter
MLKIPYNLQICGLSMILLNYNVAINSYAIILLERTESIEFFNHPTIIHATIVVGLLVGILIFGFLNAFILNVKSSFKICSLLMIIGGILSIIPGYMGLSRNSTKLFDFSAARFIVGLGCGGLFSGVSILFRENFSKDVGNSNIAMIYGPIGSLGLILAPLVITVFDNTQIFSDDVAWKVALLIGTLPIAFLLIYDVDSMPNDPKLTKSSLMPGQDSISSYWSTFIDEFNRKSTNTVFKLYISGASMACVCIDAIFYGNFLVIVRIVDHLFLKTAYNPRSFISVALMGVNCGLFFWCGGLISLWGLRRISALALQLHGFILMAGTFLILAVSKVFLLNEWWPVLMSAYSLIFLFAGFGPAPMTYLMPSVLFPSNLRTPLNGLVAALGKLGAIFGILVSHYFYTEISTLMFIFSALSLLGAGCTFLLLNARFLSKKSIEGYEPVEQFEESIPSENGIIISDDNKKEEFT